MLAAFLDHPAGIALVALIVCLDITCLVITILKGKYWFAAIGILLHPLWYIGAVRLAKPGSRWARRYDEDKRRASIARFPADAPAG